MTKTAMETDLLHSLQILTHLVIQVVREELRVLSILAIMLTIEEPVRDLVALRVLHDSDNTFQLGLVKFTSTLQKFSLNYTKIGGWWYRLLRSTSALRQTRPA